MLFKCFIGRDKKDYGLDSDFSEVLGCQLIKCEDLLVQDLIEIDKENKFITDQLKGASFFSAHFSSSILMWLRSYLTNLVKHLYGNHREFNYNIFKNGNTKYIFAYYRKGLRDISGMIEFDDALDFLEKMRDMKIKAPKIELRAIVVRDERD